MKIISGGQTGVDQAALDAAMKLGIASGGWCPPGRLCEDGTIPAKYALVETPFERSPRAPYISRSLRTEWNVRDADGVLFLCPDGVCSDEGTSWALKCSLEYIKPVLIADPLGTNEVDRLALWVHDNNIETLNIAGPSEQFAPGIGEAAYKLIIKLLKCVM